MVILVTGGAGFIGRWVIQKLIDRKDNVVAFDNLSNGSIDNIRNFQNNSLFKFINADIQSEKAIESCLKDIDLCIHLAAQINVQESLDYPSRTFNSNILGTYNILEACRKKDIKLIVVGTCMVYDLAGLKPISETDPVKPLSPYAGSKVAAEALAMSYFYGYKLPVAIVRPFNTYGPYQKSNMEGGVVSIFINRYLSGEDLLIYGNGEQTRDLLYVEDCADFIVQSAFSHAAIGQVLNGGTGKDIKIKDLALMICKDPARIKYVPHHHAQSEIPKLVCDFSKAEKILGWKPLMSLEQGIGLTMDWQKHR